MAITKNLCHLLGGDISVASELGKGSCFNVICKVTCSKESTKLQSELVKENTRCLIVDNNASTRHTLQNQLGLWGVNASTASSLQEAATLYLADEISEQGPLSFDIGDLYYFYPGESNEVQFNEYYFSVGTEIPLGMVAEDFSVSPSVYFAYAPKWFGANTPDVFYTELGIEAPIPGTPFSVSYTYGDINVDDLEGDAEKANTIDGWNYYYITLGFGEILGLDTSITYHNAPGYSADAGQDGFFVSLGHEW